MIVQGGENLHNMLETLSNEKLGKLIKENSRRYLTLGSSHKDYRIYLQVISDCEAELKKRETNENY